MLSFAILAATLAAAPPLTAPAPERSNALAFENGAILLSDGGSYGSELSGWSAWHLTDGDEEQGWCSPEGKPTGLAFVWDLDTTWRLDTFAVSTKHLQEAGYPGISARTLELWAGDGSTFRKVGSFTIGKEERKEFPLPKGTSARQVKVVVAANHGNASFTEIAELELFGERTGTVAPPKIAGEYTTEFGAMKLVVEGRDVYGCYVHGDGATVVGTLEGRNARVTWTEPGQTVRSGPATFAVTPDGKSLVGVWYEGGTLRGAWSGERAAAGSATCTLPRKGGQLDTLAKRGRAVLYGIRFDSGSDVPRPESDATLGEVAAFLKKEPSVRLLVEGHTDATNTDAYNLDLSQRRAKAVVAALVKRGVDGGRLKAEGFGRTKPVADNATAAGRALNRRVEVSVLK